MHQFAGQVAALQRGDRLAEASSASRCYGLQGQCRDRRIRKPVGAVLRANTGGNSAQKGAGEVVWRREERPQKTAQEIQRG